MFYYLFYDFGFFILLFLVFWIWRLSRRIRKLEHLTQGKSTATHPSVEEVKKEIPEAQLVSPEEKFKAAPDFKPLGGHTVSPGERFANWVKEDWLMKLGGLLLLIGFAWLSVYAFAEGWIGPAGRIALGFFGGTGLLFLGWRRMQNFVHQGSIFLVLGSTVILLTTFAARNLYDFFTPLSALVLMFLSTAFVGLASVRFKSRSLALASLILAALAPLLTSSVDPTVAGLFGYLFVVILGAIWIVALTGQRILVPAGLIIVGFYSLSYFDTRSVADQEMVLLFIYGFAALFFFVNTLGLLKLRGKAATPDLFSAVVNATLLLGWIMSAAQEEWQSLIITAWMLVFLIGAFSIFKVTQERHPFFIYAGVGVAMLVAATFAELKESFVALTMAFTIEASLITVLTHVLLRDIHITSRASFLIVGPVFLSMNSLGASEWEHSIFHEHFFALAILTGCLFGLGFFFKRQLHEGSSEIKRLASTFFVVASIYVYAIMWLSLHAVMERDFATMVALIIYTIVGLYAYFHGRFKDNHGVLVYGGTLIGVVVARLLFVEVWGMELTGRIITFFLIGILLMSTAFIGRKKTPVSDNNTH